MTQFSQHRQQTLIECLRAAGKYQHALCVGPSEHRAQGSAGQRVVGVIDLSVLAKTAGVERESGADSGKMQDEGSTPAARLQQPGKLGDERQVITIFAGADNHAVDFTRADQSIEIGHQFGAVLAPGGAKTVALLAGRAAIMDTQHLRRFLRCQVDR